MRIMDGPVMVGKNNVDAGEDALGLVNQLDGQGSGVLQDAITIYVISV